MRMLRALDRLVELKGQFGRDAEPRVVALLTRLERTRLRDPAALIRLHETVLFLRAYPQSQRVVHWAEKILANFAARIRGLDPEPFEDPEVSGIAGTCVSTNFSYEIARSLTTRHRRAIEIDWENYRRADRLGAVLAPLIPLAGEDWAVEPHPDWHGWFAAARGNIQFLLDEVDRDTYDLLEIPLRWKLGDSTAARSRTRIPRQNIFYHDRPFLKRSDVSLETEFAAPKLAVTRLSRRRAGKILEVIIDTSSVRYRELYGFTHPDLDHVYHADLGRGVDIFFFGVPDEWRLPLRAYHCGMFFKNGVPMGYIEGMSLFERMEVGFNLYYTFREGETAWLYARLLKLFREQLRVTCYWVDAYQLGHQNEEAIESGAFWFYRKLGFRTTSQAVARLVAREESRIAQRPGYRSSPAILRRLAQAPLIYGGGPEWDRFELRNLRRAHSQPWNTREIMRAKHAPEEIGYLRLLQRLPWLREAMLGLGS